MNATTAAGVPEGSEVIPDGHGVCRITGNVFELRRPKSIALPWPVELHYRKGAPQRLAGINIYHDFDWVSEFGHSRGAFPNGEYLAHQVKRDCSDGKTPALVLTKQEGIVLESFDWNDLWCIVVVNINTYRTQIAGNPAVDFIVANRFKSRLTRIADLEIDEQAIASWAGENPERIAKLNALADRLGGGASRATTSEDVRRVFEMVARIDGDLVDLVLDLFHKGGVKADFVLRRLLETGEIDDISGTLDWLLQGDNRKIAKQFSKLQASSLQKLNSIAGLTALEKAWDIWIANRTNASEEFWQQQLQEHSFVLSQICTHPIVLIKGKAYVGGKGIENTHGNVVDFLCKNAHTHNVVLVEIKTPCTELLSRSLYRGDAYNIGPDISGATIQIATQRAAFIKECNDLRANSDSHFVAHQPQCIIVAGDTNQLTSDRHVKSFELYRRSLTGIEILTYDELFARVRSFIDVFGSTVQ